MRRSFHSLGFAIRNLARLLMGYLSADAVQIYHVQHQSSAIFVPRWLLFSVFPESSTMFFIVNYGCILMLPSWQRISLCKTGILFLLLFTIVTPYLANGDTSDPQLHGVSFDRQTANAGDTVTVHVNATDDTTISRIFVVVRAFSNEHVDLAWSFDTRNYTGTFVINQYWPTSISVYAIWIEDNAGNGGYLYDGTDYTSPVLSLLDTTPDPVPPTLHWVEFDRTTVRHDEDFTIVANITDDFSGVTSANLWYHDGEGELISNAILGPNAKTGLFEATTTASDTWIFPIYIEMLSIRDNAGSHQWFMNGTHFTSPLLYFDPTQPEKIEVSISPAKSSSVLNEPVTYEVKVESTFVHDMPNVTLEFSGTMSDGTEVFHYENTLFLEANSTIVTPYEVIFTELGICEVKATLFDDIEHPWTDLFLLEVVKGEQVDTPDTSKDPKTNDTNSESDTQSIAVDIPLGDSSFIAWFTITSSLGMMVIVLYQRRRVD